MKSSPARTLLRIVIFLPILAAGAEPAAAPNPYLHILTPYLRGDFREALRAADNVIDIDGKNASALALRARIWDVLGERARMKQDCKTVLSLVGSDSEDPDALLARGSALLLKGETDKALDMFNYLLRTAPSPEGFAARARTWRAKGDYSAELSDLDAAIKLSRQSLYLHKRALAYHDLGQYDKALTDLTEALGLNKNSAISFGLLGEVMARKGDLDRAAKAYGKALSLDPQYAYAYLGRAAVRLGQGGADAALKDLAAAIRINESDYAPWLNRAERYWRLGRKEEALADYRQALDSPGLNDPRALLAMGDRLAANLLWAQAVEAYTRAAQAAPSAVPFMRMAAAKEALRRPKEALSDLDEAVAVEPASTAPWVARSVLNMTLGRHDEALADISRALKIAPESAGVRVARGRFYARMGKPALALADFNYAIERDPDLAEAYNSRGALYANALGDLDKGLKDIVAAVVLRPDEPNYQFNLGMMQLRSRQYDKALTAFGAALSHKGPQLRILQVRAETYARLGDHSSALRDIHAAMDNEPRNPATYDALGLIRLLAHEYEQAVRDLNQSLRISDYYLAALVHRGQAYGALGELKAAVADFKSAVNVDPRAKEAWLGSCMARRLRKDYSQAIADCDHALELDPKYAPAYLQRGLAFLRLPEPHRAVSDLDNAYRSGMQRAEVLLARSYGHALAKQYKEAHRAYMAAMAIDPNIRSFQSGFSAVKDGSEDYFTALADIEALMAPGLNDPYALILRADALHNSGHYDKAIIEYTRAMETDGSLYEAYVGRANCLFAQDSYDAAQQDYLRAAELAPQDPDARLRLATLLTIRRNYKAALEEVVKVIRSHPDNHEAYLRAGNIRYFQGDYAKALDNYRLAVRYDPDSAAAHNGVGMGNFALRRYPEALDAYSRAISLNPFVDRYYRNRASAYTNLRRFSDAAAEFKSASLVNIDPAMVEEYQKLIKEAEAQAGKD